MKNNIFIALLSIFMLASCNDFLDIRPEGTVPSAGMDYTKAENIFKPVSAAYASLRDGNAHAFNYICTFEITSDDADKGSTPADNPEAKSMDDFTFTSTNGLIDGLWVGYYNIVSAANNAIGQMPHFEAAMKTEANKYYTKQCASEAKVIRAYAYFNLTRAFGRIPIIDTTLTSEQLAALHQSSPSDLYKFIEKDLQEAIPFLPAFYSKEYAGRITSYTAMALKAKVHMYHAAIENSVANWDSVASLTDRIIASGKFNLMPNFRTEFSMDGENSSESLFEIQSSSLGASTGDNYPFVEYAYIQGPRNNSPSNMQGWGFCTPSNRLVNFLTQRGETDRIAATFLYRGSVTPEGDSIKMSCANPIYNGKVYTPSSYNKWNYNGYGFDHNLRIIRYSDVLLMFAEALTNGTNIPVKSGFTPLTAVNTVRQRVHLTPLGGVSLLDIYDERRAEFALEEDRFFDLIRTNRAATVLAPLGFVSPKNNFLPIPSAEMQLNTNLVQNPGY
jgi:hypothetical protein